MTNIILITIFLIFITLNVEVKCFDIKNILNNDMINTFIDEPYENYIKIKEMLNNAYHKYKKNTSGKKNKSYSNSNNRKRKLQVFDDSHVK